MVYACCQGISPRVGLSPPWLGKSQASRHCSSCARSLAYSTLERVDAPEGEVSEPAPLRHAHGVLTTCRQGQQVPNASVVFRMRARMLLCARALRPLAHPAAYLHAQSTQAASTAGARQRSVVEARLAQSKASHGCRAAASPSRWKGPRLSPPRGGEDPPKGERM